MDINITEYNQPRENRDVYFSRIDDVTDDTEFIIYIIKTNT